jgi:hypothetical protein
MTQKNSKWDETCLGLVIFNFFVESPLNSFAMSTLSDFDKNSARLILLPMFDLLLYKKKKLSHDEWIAFANRTQSSIIQSPQQFLGNEIPDQSIVEKTVREIFAEFFEEQSVAV